MKLKIKMDVYGRYVSMIILEQCPTIVNNVVNSCLSYKSTNGVSIYSESRPYLNDGCIALRGFHSEYHDELVTKEFNTPEEAREALENYIEALEEWSSNWYFKDSTNIPTPILGTNDIYDFDKLKIKLDVFGNSVVYTILDQCPSFALKLKDMGHLNSLDYIALNGIAISAHHGPSHTSNYSVDVVGIRGSIEGKDNDAVMIRQSTHEEAIEYKGKILRALEEWRTNGYFSKSQNKEKSNNVYEF